MHDFAGGGHLYHTWHDFIMPYYMTVVENLNMVETANSIKPSGKLVPGPLDIFRKHQLYLAGDPTGVNDRYGQFLKIFSNDAVKLWRSLYADLPKVRQLKPLGRSPLTII
jgi:hypothetical protein